MSGSPARPSVHNDESPSAGTHGGRAAAIESQIEQTRRRIEATLTALKAKLSVRRVMAGAGNVVKRHPLETALLVVAVATCAVWHTAVLPERRRRP